MKVRKSIIAAGAVVALSTAGALVLPAVASAHSTTHTLKFVSVQKASVTFSKTNFGQQDTDVNAKGKTIGFDELNITATSATSANGGVTVDLSGGFLYGTFALNFKTGAVTNGKITGGTGGFAGATGTFTAKDISKTKTAVVVKYST
jgi:hypothetical protein